MTQPVMPKATAVWLIENTALTFEQIGDFCGMHRYEVQTLADAEFSVRGFDPVANSRLTAEEIERCTADPSARLQGLETPVASQAPKRRGAKYVPITRRGDKPDAIAWLLRHHPELSDTDIARLIGTSKQTIGKVRDRTHQNMQTISPQHPVSLKLCTAEEFEAMVVKERVLSASVAWLLANHPELSDADVARLSAGSKRSVARVRERIKSNTQTVPPEDPVTLGVCTLEKFEATISKAQASTAAS